MKIAFDLKQALKKHNVSQNKLAKMLGKQPSAVSVYVKPDYNPTFSTIARFAEILKCPISDFIVEEKSVTKKK